MSWNIKVSKCKILINRKMLFLIMEWIKVPNREDDRHNTRHNMTFENTPITLPHVEILRPILISLLWKLLLRVGNTVKLTRRYFKRPSLKAKSSNRLEEPEDLFRMVLWRPISDDGVPRVGQTHCLRNSPRYLKKAKANECEVG